ncbi:hypothetical protein H5410_053777 [Solanum commersonii]|uniref:Uncharacterized protein n=1 Tax=Solanum commersonii TaxID=4109 RepID=A0A9J5X7C1_SOLCO|nr:hypothetical protein H5410_053777 [Solanum commersonii]
MDSPTLMVSSLANRLKVFVEGRNTTLTAEKIWHHKIPFKISFFMLRLLKNKLLMIKLSIDFVSQDHLDVLVVRTMLL